MFSAGQSRSDGLARSERDCDRRTRAMPTADVDRASAALSVIDRLLGRGGTVVNVNANIGVPDCAAGAYAQRKCWRPTTGQAFVART